MKKKNIKCERQPSLRRIAGFEFLCCCFHCCKWVSIWVYLVELSVFVCLSVLSYENDSFPIKKMVFASKVPSASGSSSEVVSLMLQLRRH